MIENSNLKLEQAEILNSGDGLNWYAYCGNNPLRFVDPSGLTILDVKGDTHQQDSEAQLGGGKTIAKEGCVLEAAVRIARGISGDDSISLEDANAYAKDNELFKGEKKDILTTESVAELISGLTGEKIGFGSIDGPDQVIKEGISDLDSSKKDYYVTGRIDDEHTVSINEGLTLKDYHMGDDQQPVVDTSITGRTSVDDGVSGSEELTRADYFYVEE